MLSSVCVCVHTHVNVAFNNLVAITVRDVNAMMWQLVWELSRPGQQAGNA
jgi:hypothetical protein